MSAQQAVIIYFDMNDNFTRELMESLGETVAQKLSAKNVVSSDQAKDALSSLSPVILSSLKRKQATLGEGGIEELLERAGATESHLDDLDSTLDPVTNTPDLGAILDPETENQTVSALSEKLGIGGGIAKQLLPMLVPVILGMLMKKGKQGGGSRSSGIGGILDRDGDGSMIDDIAGMILGGGQSRKMGFFQMILSMLFGRK